MVGLIPDPFICLYLHGDGSRYTIERQGNEDSTGLVPGLCRRGGFEWRE